MRMREMQIFVHIFAHIFANITNMRQCASENIGAWPSLVQNTLFSIRLGGKKLVFVQ